MGRSYQTNELRDIQFDTFRDLWKAVAYHEDDFFISYRKVSKSLDLWDGFYTQHITEPRMLGSKLNENLIDKLNGFINEEESLTSPDVIKLKVYSDAIVNLIQLQKAKLEAEKIWLETDTGVLSWFDQLFEPGRRDPRYSYGFKDSSIYKAWSICMNIFELFGTDPMTGHSIPDGAFNTDEQGRFASHHIDRNNKASLALYDQILTWNSYHPDPYESFSELMGETHQRMLKYRLRKLFELGINKDESLVQDSNWITEDDFKAIFPDDLEFKVEFRNGDRFEGSLFYLWNNVFTDKTFNNKLSDINKKIDIFRKALKDGRNPYLELLKRIYPSAEERFLEHAITFATAFNRLGVERLVPTERGHSADELAYIWHIYLMKQAFDLE